MTIEVPYFQSPDSHSGRHRGMHLRSHSRIFRLAGKKATPSRSRRAIKGGVALVLVTSLAACMVGPDYRKPEVQVPEGFKEGVDWQRA
ncbi:MAG: hypothetical protein QOF46_3144 [Paraburkholderia sp.]|nr:hypothetical protein [Paraburkholderia sp.]